ncbi:MAG: hypothetical protein ACOC8S_00995 [Bacteroidota bacterium]
MAAAVAVGVAALQQLKLTVAGRYFKGAGGFPLGIKGLRAGRKKLQQWQPL